MNWNEKGYTFSEVKPRIFFLNFKDSYNMSMHFMRYQEFYESPSSRFRDRAFTWVDFMEWYSKKFGQGSFSYATDWAGFNFPGHVIKSVRQLGITDYNKYDEEMARVWERCSQKYPDEKFYIIGAVGETWALKHEIAHGFFYTKEDYKKEMTQLVKALTPAFRSKMNANLKRIGYAPKVYIDECQAYMSTGVPVGFKLKVNKQQQPFVELYKKHYNA